MGFRLHTAKVYVVEYESSGRFNNAKDLVVKLINDALDWVIDADSDFWEIDVEDFQSVIDYVKGITDKEFERRYHYCNHGMTRTEIIGNLEYLMSQRDTRNTEINLAWF